jgi:sporulation protein YlmC with PRC-barrel domain
MLQNIKKLYGNKLNASDGDIGTLENFYFDDQSWNIRYLVVETGIWLIERQVLISPYSIHRLDQEDQVLIVDLTRKQIEDSPPIERHRPVSRQFEAEYYTYYGWPYYWTGDTLLGVGGNPLQALNTSAVLQVNKEEHLRDDTHLRSALEVAGYEIEAIDGTVGRITDLVVDDEDWAIKELIVETGHWYAGKEIRIPVDQITSVSYFDSRVHVSLTKEDIEQTGEHHVAHTHHH